MHLTPDRSSRYHIVVGPTPVGDMDNLKWSASLSVGNYTRDSAEPN